MSLDLQKCHLTPRQTRVLRSARLVDGSLLDSLNMSKAWLLTENAEGLHDHKREFLKLSEKSHASVACFMASHLPAIITIPVLYTVGCAIWNIQYIQRTMLNKALRILRKSPPGCHLLGDFIQVTSC